MELQGKHILVIDDEPLMCQLVKSIFTNEGAIVTTALSGREGLRKLGERKPDLILLDILMPGESGWEICQKIRDFSKVPVIMLTARSGGEARSVEATVFGFDRLAALPEGVARVSRG